MKITNGKDFWAGVMFIAFGLAFMVVAQNYAMGNAVRMGPAYFPTVLGGMLAVLGAAVFLRAFMSKIEHPLRVFPFRDSFFVGSSFGRQSLQGAVTEGTPLGPQTALVDLTTLYATPRAGWMWTFEPGFLVAVDLGIPALVVYLLLFHRTLRSVVQARRVWRARDVDLSHLAQGLEISLIGFAVAAMFYPVAYHLFFFYLAGLAVAVKRLCREQVSPVPAASAPSPARAGRRRHEVRLERTPR